MIYIDELLEFKKETIGNAQKYFCLVRKSFIPATPEEKVRQNFLKYLVEEKSFPIERIKVEESLAHYGKGNQRIDILILDKNNLPHFIYECKKEHEPLTEDVVFQAFGYFEKLETVMYLGIVIGNELDLLKYKDEYPFLFAVEQPSTKMLASGKDIFIEEDDYKYVRKDWKNPVTQAAIDELMHFGIIGEGTDKSYFSFLVNLNGWLLDSQDKLEINKSIEDIGFKYTKFGSVSGGNFAKEYRSFLLNDKKDKPIVCIALTEMPGGMNSPVGTVILVGIETTSYRNSSLELRIGRSVNIEDGKITIEHNGSITVGKLGASKRQDLIDFVKVRKPHLVKGKSVHLGVFEENQEINSTNVGLFIENLIEYALLRNEFRDVKKRAIANK